MHETLARWISDAKRTVAFTGAGISTESGIPDFRSPGGIWTRFRMIQYPEFMASAEARREYWEQKAAGQLDFATARPNAGHTALANWERQDRLVGVITQNIDGLHQAAGSQRVYELHGTALVAECQDCHARFDVAPLVEAFRNTNAVPPCPACGGDRLKHATVSFGQALPPEVTQAAFQLARDADLMLAIGSSLVVEPAASIPRTTKRYGGRVVIINRDPTTQDDDADLVIRASIGETLSAVAALIES